MKSKILFCVLVAGLLSYPLCKTLQPNAPSPVFAFLIPHASDSLPETKIWLKAAQEEGLPLETLHYEDVFAPLRKAEITSKVIVLPDEAAKLAPASMVSILQKYVREGGKLVLVGNALTSDFNGRFLESLPLSSYFHFPEVEGRVGDTLQLKYDSLRITDEWLKKLRIPPGQYTPSDWEQQTITYRELSTYQSLKAPYPHWGTSPATLFSGTKIIEANDGSLVAGIQKLGRGEVLWINLPLAYLKKRTDGLLLHSFLRWISEDWAGLPRLLSVPDGIGGIVLNIHIDSNAALPWLELMKKRDLFSQGPFSIHVTAGPDARTIGDGLGLNLPKNQKAQAWIRYFVKQGHEVGSHGGWIHDYFGLRLKETPTDEFRNFLELNQHWLEEITGKPIREYSAPLGNFPIWVAHWIEEHGFNSYYFTGNNGMGPTQTFRDDELTDHQTWSFPIAVYRQAASFEEANDLKIPAAEFSDWLASLSQFVSRNHQVRLFYFHPPGLSFYQKTLIDWLKANEKMAMQGQFHWFTMSRMANFLNARAEVKWNIVSNPMSQEKIVTITPHPELKSMVWAFSNQKIKNISIVSGHAQVRRLENETLVQPFEVEPIVIRYEEVQL